MSFRFRQRIRVLPGVYLNIGKGGVSVTLGGRGLSYTIGKNGTRKTFGLPGTGMSWTSSKKRGKK